MGNARKLQIFGILVVATGFILGSSAEAFADRGRGRGNGRGHGRGYKPRYERHHPYYGMVVNFPNFEAKVVLHSGTQFYYRQGFFYRSEPRGYIIVDPPVGAVVVSLPPGYRKVYVNKRPYYYYNDVYYLKTTRGYIVVADPVYNVVELQPDVQIIDTPDYERVSLSLSSLGGYTVNIPNADGSFTAVVLKEAGSGYRGPQGEYYDSFPPVKQLQAMYGK